MIKRWLASSAAATALLIVRAAAAQTQYTAQSDSPQWLKDRRYTEGTGVRTGELELHPGLGGEIGYDSNWLLRSTQNNVANGPPVAPDIPALTFRLTPSLYLSTITPPRMEGVHADSPAIAFRAGASATLFSLLGISSDPAAGSLLNKLNVFDATISADARLDILPSRPVGGSVSVTYGRVVLPNAATADANQSFTHDDISAAGDLALIPSSGTLDWHFGYSFATSIFETTAGSPFTNYTHQAYTRGRWRFSPRTALVYDLTLGFNLYSNAAAANNVGLVQSDPLRTRIGLNGLVTDRFAVLALIGWGASFVDNPASAPLMQQYDSLIANAELKWYLAASPGISKATELGLTLSSIALGYTRDFQASYLGNFYGTDRGYLKFNYFFAGRALASIEGGVSAIEYPHLYWLNGQGRGVLLDNNEDPATANPSRGVGFTDVRADVGVFGEYRFSDSLGLNSTFRYSQNFSNARVEVAQPGSQAASMTLANQLYYGMAWQRFEVLLGFRWFL